MKNLTLKSLLAISLICFSAVAVAGDRDRRGFDNGDRWRLGNGHDTYGIYHRINGQWRRMPGSATAVGDGWVIGTDRRSGGYGIYRWNGRGWIRVSGGAVSIGGTYEQPWIINNRGEQFYWNGYDWNEARGGRRQLTDTRSRQAFSARNQLDDRRRDNRRR